MLDLHLHRKVNDRLLADVAEIKQNVRKMYCLLENLMSKISEFAERQNQHNQAIGTAIDGISEDIAELNEKITELQGTQGQITPEDQALLDEIETAGAALADRIKAVDELTPPVVPTVP